jgi:sugar lactone lactonase YvrE
LLLLLLQGAWALAAPSKPFPKRILLPDGFQPEGIVTGRGTDFYVGSLGHLEEDGLTITGGAIYKGDLRSGEGRVLVSSDTGQMALGLAVDRRTNYLFVAGGPFGNARVYDAATGETVAEYQLTTLPFLTTLVNDVIVTQHAAYFTDSFQPVLYRVPLRPDGALPEPVIVQEIPLGGGFDHVPGQINANGIDATPNGAWLVVINYYLGTLYRVDPDSGTAMQIDLGGDTVPFGDGILLDGLTLYVMQNEFNQIAVVELMPDLLSGDVVRYITDPDFKVPTTIAGFGSDLYAVNARFDVAPPPLPGNPPADPDLEYDVIKVPKH